MQSSDGERRCRGVGGNGICQPVGRWLLRETQSRRDTRGAATGAPASSDHSSLERDLMCRKTASKMHVSKVRQGGGEGAAAQGGGAWLFSVRFLGEARAAT